MILLNISAFDTESGKIIINEEIGKFVDVSIVDEIVSGIFDKYLYKLFDKISRKDLIKDIQSCFEDFDGFLTLEEKLTIVPEMSYDCSEEILDQCTCPRCEEEFFILTEFAKFQIPSLKEIEMETCGELCQKCSTEYKRLQKYVQQ